jgi:hypothetical protein
MGPKARAPKSGQIVGGIWVASKDTLAEAMDSDRCCYTTSVVVAALPVLSILNTLHEAAGAASSLGETIAGTAQLVFYGCAAGCVGCVLMSLFYSPGRQ